MTHGFNHRAAIAGWALAFVATAAGASNYKVLHAFTGAPDGEEPCSNIVELGGVLYGMASYGGVNDLGMIYSLTLDGAYRGVIHSFGNGRDGASPFSNLSKSGQVVYGTTSGGGRNDYGTVFKLTPDGKEKVLFRFNAKDGDSPGAAPIRVGDMLYGTASSGGRRNSGTVYALTLDGQSKKVLHSFKYGSDNGFAPDAPLTKLDGVFYGSLYFSGQTGEGGGAAYSITPSGEFKVVHRFGGAGEPSNPSALLRVGNSFYGTAGGGAYGYGAVFTMTPEGKVTILHSFNGTDGEGLGSLVELNGTIYGTTAQGGHYGLGTLFSITPEGTFQTLRSFTGVLKDGFYPGGLSVINGRIYGITVAGGNGCGGSGCGTVFEYIP